MVNFLEPYNQFSEHDEKTLKRLVDEIYFGLLCEVGCWTGHSTAILAQRAKEINSKLIVIDNFKGNTGTPLWDYSKEHNVRDIFLNNMEELGLRNNIILFDMDSVEAHKFIDSHKLAFLFIDAGHTYADVSRDIINYLPKVKSDGLICGHDYESNTYDEKYINEDYVDGKHHGVIKAVNELIGDVNYEGRMWWVKLKN